MFKLNKHRRFNYTPRFFKGKDGIPTSFESKFSNANARGIIFPLVFPFSPTKKIINPDFIILMIWIKLVTLSVV